MTTFICNKCSERITLTVRNLPEKITCPDCKNTLIVAEQKTYIRAERLSFDEIAEQIERCPITFLPALLIKVVERCAKEKVFIGLKGMQKVVEKIYAKNQKKR